MHREGAELAFTYQNDKLKGRVEEFAAQLGSALFWNVTLHKTKSIDGMFAELAKAWPKFDGLFTPSASHLGDELDGDDVNAVTRDGFRFAHDISSTASLRWQNPAARRQSGRSPRTCPTSWRRTCNPNYNVMGLAKAASLEAERALHGERNGS
ncbi:SDR family oxidoreductase [Shigella flexneri]